MAASNKIEAMVRTANWRMRWEIVPGVWTPGYDTFDARSILNEYGIPEDLDGKTAIDIGAWDGAIAFELERRGAKVLAADIQHPDVTAFNTAKKILGSRCDYLEASVYDLPGLLRGLTFDVIVFRGVYYHLKNPIGAFEAISHLAKPGTITAFEGECLRHYAETLSGSDASKDVVKLADSEVPICLIYPGTYKNGENWHVPNIACFKGWMQAAGFDVEHLWTWESKADDVRGQRLMARCVRNDKEIAIEHTIIKPDDRDRHNDWAARHGKLASAHKS